MHIAKYGLGTTRPNPMVGCVIVNNDRIIGEGFTSPYGGDHAEVNAIHSVRDRSLLKDVTLYVTLEPCSHHGKTPPCSDLIIKNNIPNVVIGCLDDNEIVAGKGIEKLRKAGCNVTVSVLENECKEHHKRFFTFHNKNRPYIILKWAETKDGFIAPKSKGKLKPVWITNERSRQLVHKWRAEEQAILVGSNTVLQDNPTLTVRDWTGQNPTRIVLDPEQSLLKDFNAFNDDAETILISSKLEDRRPKFDKNRNWNLEFIDWNLKNNIAIQICNILLKNNINSVIIEGGAQTLQTFIDEGLWDEARVFTGTIEFKEGVIGPKFSGKLISKASIEEDILKIYLND